MPMDLAYQQATSSTSQHELGFLVFLVFNSLLFLKGTRSIEGTSFYYFRNHSQKKAKQNKHEEICPWP